MFTKKILQSGQFSFEGGMEVFPQKILQSIQAQGVKVHCNTSVLNYQRDNGKVVASLVGGEKLKADWVVSTVPAPVLKSHLSNTCPEAGSLLDTISYASVAQVHLGYDESLLQHKGFGYLVPCFEGNGVIGVVFLSSIFPSENHLPKETRLSILLGGARFPEILNLSDEELLAMALHAVKAHLKIEKKPTVAKVHRSYQAIPQYKVGYENNIKQLKKTLSREFPELHILGNAFHGISINDCVHEAKKFVTSYHSLT